MNYEIELSDGTDEDAKAAIFNGLKSYNTNRFGPAEWKDLVIALRNDDGQVIGGLSGHTARGWLYTALLFIPEELRGQGLGPKLLGMAEDEARKRGCKGAYIDTMNPEALALYQKCGYTTFGQIEDINDGFALTYLKKSLI
ncbi:GNAT family N-acetyltransferase [Agrobacterium larrymoorei]|uniref:GNAT family N-acetyltransferase n=1 Tax=Agrobacterium larrymoorei TaxID=160699 RepID=A0A4D7DMZ8_9HYPH|nr:GNAT family N-acetyltransferase [Agrobacterium larrymoorei]QCI97267.1 GNAT family N-acetyltransferase [Agrobacterium larrymoorei]QYA07299.1 GNAT family N-acetyltransferase [Agrobacterium larrymoorei]